jgi:hypothetical protein
LSSNRSTTLGDPNHGLKAGVPGAWAHPDLMVPLLAGGSMQ